VARHNICWAEKFQVFPVRSAWIEDPNGFYNKMAAGAGCVRREVCVLILMMQNRAASDDIISLVRLGANHSLNASRQPFMKGKGKRRC
jgi:hypothetical protein